MSIILDDNTFDDINKTLIDLENDLEVHDSWVLRNRFFISLSSKIQKLASLVEANRGKEL